MHKLKKRKEIGKDDVPDDNREKQNLSQDHKGRNTLRYGVPRYRRVRNIQIVRIRDCKSRKQLFVVITGDAERIFT